MGDESKLRSVREVRGRLRLGVRVTTKRDVVVGSARVGAGKLLGREQSGK